MDFTPTPRQAELIAQVDRAVEETGGLERVRAFAFKQRLDTELERALAAVIHPGDLAVDAEATRWMAREASYSGQERAMWLAASYAAAVGAALSPDAVQLWGARGFVYEFGVSNLIMRVQGLRLELGSADRLAESVLASR